MSLPSGTVTFLFTDIEGSTKRWEANPERMRGALERHDELMRGAIARNNGSVFKTVGDSFCAAFSVAEDAANAAKQAAEELARCEEPFLVRMAIHTASIAPTEDDYFGAPLSRAARLLGIANGGQILLSDTARTLLPGGTPAKDLGTHALKDLLEPMHVWQLGTGDFPALAGIGEVPHNLPVQSTSFVGREAEMLQLAELLERARLLTLTGTGGTGKTRLAIQLAAEHFDWFPDGVWFCELAALPQRDEVLRALVTAVSAPEGLGTLYERMVMHLGSKRCLIILDNCEHVLDAVVEVVEGLGAACPKTTLIATSREPLGLKGEITFRVPSLPCPDTSKPMSLATVASYGSTSLFLDRLKAVVPNTVLLDADAPVVARICQRLDGIPLAIELAAARGRAMGLDQIEKRLDDRFRLLTGGSRNALSRQQTLRALIDWSVQLLNALERRFLVALSVFGGGWELEAAEAVCAGSDLELEAFEVLDLLTALVDKSLVVYDRATDRYRLLETIRQYALEEFERDPGAITLRDRHAEFFLKIADGLKEGRAFAEYADGMRRFTADYENFRMAVEWTSGMEDGLGRAIRSMFDAHSGFWSLGRPQEFLRLMEPLLDRSDPAVSSELTFQSRLLTWVTQIHAGNREGLDQLLRHQDSLQDLSPALRIRCSSSICYALFCSHRYEESLEMTDQFLRVDNIDLDPIYPYFAVVKGLSLACLGRYASSVEASRRALRELSAVSNERGCLAALANIVITHCLAGEWDQALEVALELNRRSTAPRIYPGTRSAVLEAFGHCALERGERTLAAVFLGGVLEMRERSGMVADPLDALGEGTMKDAVEAALDQATRDPWIAKGRLLDWEPWFEALVPLALADCTDQVPFTELLLA